MPFQRAVNPMTQRHLQPVISPGVLTLTASLTNYFWNHHCEPKLFFSFFFIPLRKKGKKKKKSPLSLNTSLSKFSLWHFFSWANPFVDKPIRDVWLESAASPFSQTNKRAKGAAHSRWLPVIIIHHHSPGLGAAPPAVSRPLIPRSWQPAAARPLPRPFLHLALRTSGGGWRDAPGEAPSQLGMVGNIHFANM